MVPIGNIDAVLDLRPAGPGNTTKSRSDEKRPVKADTVEVSADAQKAAGSRPPIRHVRFRPRVRQGRSSATPTRPLHRNHNPSR